MSGEPLLVSDCCRESVRMESGERWVRWACVSCGKPCDPVTDDQAVPLPPDAITAAAEAIMRAQNASDDEPERWEAKMLAAAALAAAAPALLAQGAAAEREACARLVTSDAAVEAAANASDEWFGSDGDLTATLAETSRAQARVELAAVADLIRAAAPERAETPQDAPQGVPKVTGPENGSQPLSGQQDAT